MALVFPWLNTISPYLFIFDQTEDHPELRMGFMWFHLVFNSYRPSLAVYMHDWMDCLKGRNN